MPSRSLKHLLVPALAATIAAWCAPASADAPAPIPNVAGHAIFGSCPQKPVWPEQALREKRKGEVALSFLIDADASILESKVAQSSGHLDLDEAARVGLAKCKFKPASQQGTPVREWVHVRYKWVPQ